MPEGARMDRPAAAGRPSSNRPWTPPAENTGETVFAGSRAALRSLTVAEADLAVLEAPEGFHGGFKIRVAKLGQEAAAKQESWSSDAMRDAAIPFRWLARCAALDVHRLRRGAARRYGQRPLDSDVGLSADDSTGTSSTRCAPRATNSVIYAARHRQEGCEQAGAGGLFHTTYLFASVIRGCTHAVIEVNPRHVAFYGRALSFDPIGEERLNTRRQRPAVLLCAPFATIAEGIARFAGNPEAPGAGRLVVRPWLSA
jgi:hypothetical protein